MRLYKNRCKIASYNKLGQGQRGRMHALVYWDSAWSRSGVQREERTCTLESLISYPLGYKSHITLLVSLVLPLLQLTKLPDQIVALWLIQFIVVILEHTLM